MISLSSVRIISDVNAPAASCSPRISPSLRTSGATEALMCRSDALSSHMRRNIELMAGSRRSTSAPPPAPFSRAGRAAISGESIVAGANESCAVSVAVVSIGPAFRKGHARQKW
jgi:hypothetical protein